jgi:hypothetical protein
MKKNSHWMKRKREREEPRITIETDVCVSVKGVRSAIAHSLVLHLMWERVVRSPRSPPCGAISADHVTAMTMFLVIFMGFNIFYKLAASGNLHLTLV